jgi:betaine-aldehyde dehydrogenase
VMSILTYDSEEEVVRRANATEYGLAAGLVTQDPRHRYQTLRRSDVYRRTAGARLR